MITIFITGGLGNQIFQIACALGLTYKTNNKLIIGKNLITPNTHQNNNKELTVSILKKVFPDLHIVDNLDISSYYHYKEKNAEVFNYTNIYNELTNTITNNNCNNLETINIVLDGYFISEKYFEITLKCCIELTSKTNNYKEITNNFENTYFIHIRLGDYVNHFLYNIQLINYYNYCINKIIEQNNLANFIICTNEYNTHFTDYINKFPQSKNTNNTNNNNNNNNIINYIIQYKNNDAPDTLYIMKSCKGGICSNSTLSWLGAYFQQFKNENNIKKHNKDYIFMPYPWVNFVNGFTNANIKDVYPEWAQIYDTINNKLII